MPTPSRLARAIDALPRARRGAWLTFAIVVACIVAAFVGLRLHDAIARSREDVARERALLDVARARAAESLTLARASVPARNDDLRAAVERVLTANGLRYGAVDGQRGDDAQHIVIEAAPFDALVRALDQLMREDGVRVVDASIAARIDPGTVRAELALAR
jgi:type II secretory pathway component PulM